MDKIKTSLPIYAGLFVLIISILTVSIKVGERTMISTGFIRASQNDANVSLIYTVPATVSLSASSTKEISGGDFTIKYDKNKIEILPSTLIGQSGFIATGGEVDLENSLFSFSVVNSDSPVKNGILVSFNIRSLADSEILSPPKLEFITENVSLLDTGLAPINVNLKNLN